MEQIRKFLEENTIINRAEVARIAGVDKSLLTKFIKGERKLSEKSLQKIEETIKPFGFNQSTIEDKQPKTPENTAKSEHKGFDPNKLIRRTPEEARKAKEQEYKGAPSWWYGGKSATLDGRIARAEARKKGKSTKIQPNKEKIKQAQEIINKSK